MPADETVCALCFATPVELHHVTGRDPDRVQLDAGLVVALCLSHHRFVHELLRSQQLDTPPRHGWSPDAALRYRVARLAVLLGAYATYRDELLWPRLAAAMRDWTTTPRSHKKRIPK